MFPPYISGAFTNSSLKNFTQNLILFFILPLVTCPVKGQVVQKKELTSFDYHLWGELHLDRVSPNEKWVSYSMSYENGAVSTDSLFVRNVTSKASFSYLGATQSLFSRDGFFFCTTKDGLNLLNLQTGSQKTFPGVQSYEYSKSQDLLVTLAESGDQKQLVIRNSLGKMLKQITDVTEFSLSPTGENVLYSTFSNNKHALLLLNLKELHKEKWLAVAGKNDFSGFTWQAKGESVAFLATSKDDATANLLHYYTVKNDRLYTLDPASQPGFPKQCFINAELKFKLHISEDQQKIFFYIQDKSSPLEDTLGSDVEIWNGNDRLVYTDERMSGAFEMAPKIALWQPFASTVFPITSNALPSLMLSGSSRHALLSNPKEYEPQWEMEGPRDFHLLDLQTMQKSVILEKQSAHYLEITPSPTGKYIAYFRDTDWWVYDIAQNTHTNITTNIDVQFTGKVHLLMADSPFGNPGWSQEDKEILIYDEYDLWAISPQGKTFRRLTHGRESKIKYRLTPLTTTRSINYIYDGIKAQSFDLEKPLVLRATGDDEKTGYFLWKKNSPLRSIVYGDAYIDELLYSPKEQQVFYREQKFDKAPRLIVTQNLSPSVVFQSNPQQSKYYWGKSELVRYQNSKGQDLKGALFYPANYDPQKKYPMIVSIYELQARELHCYLNPTLYNGTGFNITLATLQGYFVLLPDIVHEYQNPGISAVDCVSAAVEKVIEKGIVNPDRIGLRGHSFGGYETAFIITQTSLFRTAIASAGIMDLTSFYLTLGQNSGKPDMYRFQREQWIMGKTPFEIPLEYQRNSPIAHLPKVETPVLLWTGKSDTQVNSNQSMEFYLGLRRLGKKGIMLQYPSESHVITKPINQADLTFRTLDWLAYYLKDDLSIGWIDNGVK